MIQNAKFKIVRDFKGLGGPKEIRVIRDIRDIGVIPIL